MLNTILFNILIVLGTATAIVLGYSLRSVGKDEFDLFCWFVTNKTRFIIGGIFGVLVSVLLVISPEAALILKVIGFDASAAPVSVGAALGAILIAGVSGNKPR